MDIEELMHRLKIVNEIGEIDRTEACFHAINLINELRFKLAEIERIAETMNATNGQTMGVYEHHDKEWYNINAVSADVLHDFANAIIEVIDDNGE